MSLDHSTVEQVKTATDAGVGVLGVTVIIGWVNLAVGFCVIGWYLIRFYEYISKRGSEGKERNFYLVELKGSSSNSEEYLELLPIDELRQVYKDVKNK